MILETEGTMLHVHFVVCNDTQPKTSSGVVKIMYGTPAVPLAAVKSLRALKLCVFLSLVLKRAETPSAF